MSRLSVVNCFLLSVAFLYYATDLADSFDPPNDNRQKEASSPMWFGPRIGRKKRNPSEIKPYRNAKDQSSMGLMDVLRESPLVVVAVNEANKQQHNFTPRLGRESGENFQNWLEDAEYAEAESVPARPPGNPFSPRLGRNNYNPFSPRLGRENDVPLK